MQGSGGSTVMQGGEQSWMFQQLASRAGPRRFRSAAGMPTVSETEFYRTRSLWLESAGDLTPREALPGDTDADVAIIGAGLTGLWTAYYLAEADPSLRILVLEKDIAGFGASGRNGGWCAPFFGPSIATIAAEHGREAAVSMQRAMLDSIAEIGRVCEAERIDADYSMVGAIMAATSSAQSDRLRRSVDELHSFGFGEDEFRLLSATETDERVRAQGVSARCSSHTPRPCTPRS